MISVLLCFVMVLGWFPGTMVFAQNVDAGDAADTPVQMSLSDNKKTQDFLSIIPSAKIHTTVYDKDGKVVTSNDPAIKADSPLAKSGVMPPGTKDTDGNNKSKNVTSNEATITNTITGGSLTIGKTVTGSQDQTTRLSFSTRSMWRFCSASSGWKGLRGSPALMPIVVSTYLMPAISPTSHSAFIMLLALTCSSRASSICLAWKAS